MNQAEICLRKMLGAAQSGLAYIGLLVGIREIFAPNPQGVASQIFLPARGYAESRRIERESKRKHEGNLYFYSTHHAETALVKVHPCRRTVAKSFAPALLLRQ
jgi:hypothetical protein